MKPHRLRVAGCQYPIEAIGSVAALRRKLARWLTEARDEGVHLAVLPEYAALELLSALPSSGATLKQQLELAQPLFTEYADMCSALAQQFDIHLLSGSVPFKRGTAFFNRAGFYTPKGRAGWAEKLQMTPFEHDWGISPGGQVTLFETDLTTVGVLICYDSEFPVLSRCLAEAGAQVILVPSCTDTVAGYHRVRIACQARALENQCYVVQAVTVGEAPWCLALDVNHGAAGAYCPPDSGLPEDGVIASGKIDQPAWVFADLDLEHLAHVRQHGQVRTYVDWSRPGHLAASATHIDLR